MKYHSNQLEYPITLPLMAPARLTTEHILAEFECIIQYNKEFQVNDMGEINVIHVSMPTGGKGSKRSEVNLGKHLVKSQLFVFRTMTIYVWRESLSSPKQCSITMHTARASSIIVGR